MMMSEICIMKIFKLNDVNVELAVSPTFYRVMLLTINSAFLNGYFKKKHFTFQTIVNVLQLKLNRSQ